MSFKVIGIGEVLWDLLPSGPQLGGAPVNFACHARQLGAEAQVITRVGNDAPGRQILARLEEMGISDDAVQTDDRLPTGAATVTLDADGVAQFTIGKDAAWDNLGLTDEALAAVQKADAICFGTLAQRRPTAAATIQQLVAAAPFFSLRVFDLNLRQGFYSREVVEQSLAIANVVKLNEAELAALSAIFVLTRNIRQKIEQLSRRFDLRLVALTRGGQGSLLHQSGQWTELPGSPVTIVDTVGAGDAFTAALVMGMLHKLTLADVHRLAADVAGYICSRPGATPVLPEDLRAALAPHCASV
jgi:fructokinase